MLKQVDPPPFKVISFKHGNIYMVTLGYVHMLVHTETATDTRAESVCISHAESVL